MNRSSAQLAAGHRPDRVAIGLDIGGTKIAGGIVTAAGTLVETLPPVPTPGDQEGTLEVLHRTVAELRGRHPEVEAIGVGAAGLIEWPDGHIRWAPNNAYEKVPLRRILEEASGLPATVDNDANTAAWAEARLGRSADYMLFLTVGTGVGGGVVLDGQLFRGRTGIGTEVGHLIVDPHGGVRCPCGNIGCLEALASGSALRRYGTEAALSGPGGPPVTGDAIFAAARAGDPTALALYARLGDWLGIGLASLVTLFDLELIVIGGGVAAAGELLFAPARESMERFLFARGHRTEPVIAPATLGVEAGWVGAGLLALDLTA
ncbi:ROK family protein [Longispora sp. NPDC051575]|uniref:ROK family protein n=1 Tax=Longispora sp. NPDC051575 TaxID=3154943 RepID=UPI00344605BD